MEKIINPAICNIGVRRANSFAKIVYNNGILSITGVVGPLKSGNCRGSAGQCVDEIRAGEPADGWNREMLDKFCDIWGRWHLNDMRPTCEHQRELEWEEEAKEEVTIYHYVATRNAINAKKAAEEAALSALRNGDTFSPTEEQTFFAALPYSLDLYDEEITGEKARFYDPRKSLFSGDRGPTEKKARGWIRYEESERGILGKPCPVCGYRYGTAWNREEVPQEVIDWLFALPDTEVTPAWV